MRPDTLAAAGRLLSDSKNVKRILAVSPVGGGSINDAWKLHTDTGSFFVKVNSLGRYPGMFPAEARGLNLLASAGFLRTPAVIGTGEAGSDAFIILEYLNSATPSHDFWRVFGYGLAALHRISASSFGLDHDNYIGSLPQSNKNHNSWIEFFILERIEPMVRMARNSGLFDMSLGNRLQRFFARLDQVFPVEAPSLVHGDLWSGNYMTGPSGEPCIIDPAVYYGFREMDIGMSRLFGGFGQGFYDAYNDAWPMEPGWKERVDICNLYPLMVHVNLFGAGYLGQVRQILRRF